MRCKMDQNVKEKGKKEKWHEFIFFNKINIY